MALSDEIRQDIQTLAEGLTAADAAGDTERAARLAKAYKSAKRRLETVQSDPAEYDVGSEAYQERYSPTSGMSGFNRFLSGVGKGFVDIGRGVGQLTGLVDQESIDESRRLDAPLMGTGAGLAGNIVGNVAAAAPVAFIPGANTAAGATLIGGALGLAQPVATGESRGINTALGAAGGLAGQRLGRALTGARGGGLNRAERQVLDRSKALGFKQTPGRASGSTQLQQLEAALESKPFTSGPISAIKASNQSTANRIFNEAIGESGDIVDSTVLDDAFQRLGDVFETTASKVGSRPIDAQKAFGVLDDLSGRFRGVTAKPVLNNPLVEEFVDLAQSGQATGRQLRSLTSRLGKRINNEFTTPSGDRALGEALGEVKGLVDEIIASGLSGDDLARYRQAMQQYRTLSTALSRQNVIDETAGNVNLNALASVLRKNDKTGFLRGQNQSALYDAARFGRAFRPIVGDSGTATRSVGATDFVMGLPFNALSRAYFSGPSTAIAGGAGRAIGGASSLLGPAVDPRLLGLLGSSALIESQN